MKNLPEQENHNTKTNAVHIIAIISLTTCIIAWVILLVLVMMEALPFSTFIIFSISSVIELILLFSLDNAIRRITVLENVLLNKGLVETQELNPKSTDELDAIEEIADTEDLEDLAEKGITFCKECNYQLFPEDEVCPYCGAKVDKTTKN